MNRCMTCNGSGNVLGLGMIKNKCHNCLGKGVVEDKPVLDESSVHYREAIKKIRKLHPTLSKDEAEEMFKKEYEKL